MTADISTGPDGQTNGGEMNGTTATPALNKALAALQAELPHVGKDLTAKAGQYSYDYADLAAVSKALMPLLGKHGLAFSARPTMTDNGFILAYALLHESGESLHGVYPLPASGSPQQVGSAITYARRYSLCAVTGLAPGGDDDDGQAAEQAAQSAGDAWASAAPSRPRNGGDRNGSKASDRPNGSVSRPAAEPKPPAATDGEPDPDAQQYADEAHEARTLNALKAVQIKARDAHKLAALIKNPATGGVGGLGQLIEYRRKILAEVESALKALSDAAGRDTDLDAHVRKVTGAGIEDATAEQLRQATAALAGARS